MNLRGALVFGTALAVIAMTQTEASAVGRRGRMVEPVATNNSTPQTILPSAAEVLAVPAPGGGRLIGYGLTVHPGARLVRRALSR